MQIFERECSQCEKPFVDGQILLEFSEYNDDIYPNDYYFCSHKCLIDWLLNTHMDVIKIRIREGK